MVGFILVVAIVIGIVIYTSQKKTKFAEGRANLRARLIAEGNAYIDGVKANKALPIVSSTLMLDTNEKVILEESSSLFEPRSVRTNSGTGSRVRIIKGFSVGSYRGTSESHMEWRCLDTGTLSLTNQRIIFRGNKENRTIKLEKVMSINATLESLEIAIDGKAKSVSFSVKNPYIWGGAFTVAKAAEDPENLGDLNIQVEFK
jgi:hypothetical protein